MNGKHDGCSSFWWSLRRVHIVGSNRLDLVSSTTLHFLSTKSFQFHPCFCCLLVIFPKNLFIKHHLSHPKQQQSLEVMHVQRTWPMEDRVPPEHLDFVQFLRELLALEPSRRETWGFQKEFFWKMFSIVF